MLILGACAAVGTRSTSTTVAILASASATAGPQQPETAVPGRRQLWYVPSSVAGLMMHAYVFRPPGNGPFPLAVINHGSEQDAATRRSTPMPRYPALTGWLLARGYVVVLPLRPGHGETGGLYLEDQGSCDFADYAGSGRRTAISIAATIDYFVAQPFVRKTGIVVIGHSAGGWGALALAAENPPDVSRVVDFSGGRGGHNRNRPLNNCSPDNLVKAAGEFGRTARVPTLWLYAQNDTYFAPELSKRMHDAFATAGGRGVYDLLPAIGNEGHELMSSAATNWSAPLDAFLGTP
jgi:dienelactone hydrolase